MNPFAIYFPQFYPTPTNDRAWGHGFTDWSLVANANRRDAWSRRAPSRGFYDGADPAVHAAQMAEMVAGGLGGLAVYHYWFYSHQELEALERTLLGGGARADLPWFLVWASEGWSRRWVGDASPIVALPRAPSSEQIDAHCLYLIRCFEQPTYFRFKGKPVFVWYHLSYFERPAELVERYRAALHRHGVEVTFGHFVKNPFDAALASVVDVSYLFEPRLYFGFQRSGRGVRTKKAFEVVTRLVGESGAQRLLLLADRLQQKGQVFRAEDYLAYRTSADRRSWIDELPGNVQEVVSPGWNNAPRYESRFTALETLAPDAVAEQLRSASAALPGLPPLVNAWNEWSEGAAIEPCAYLGSRYLAALSAAFPPARPALGPRSA
jgi:Glycosyltransferase WbsX